MLRVASALLLFALVSCHMDTPVREAAAAGAARVTIGSVSWYVDYDAAVEVARAEGKPLWVHFGENPG